MTNCAYLTLLNSPESLTSVLVLGRSIRETGTQYPIVVLVSCPNLPDQSLSALHCVFSEVITVAPLPGTSADPSGPAESALLSPSFNKILAWNLTQYDKIAFFDPATIVLKNVDSLFDLHSFAPSDKVVSAASDIGWPDLFSTRIMVLSPNSQVFSDLSTQITHSLNHPGQGIPDEQTLINSYFQGPDFSHSQGWNRLSFSFNVTASEHYQFAPMMRHSQGDVSAFNFSAAVKPWDLKTPEARSTESASVPYRRWWEIHDRYYGAFPEGERPHDVQQTSDGYALVEKTAELSGNTEMDSADEPKVRAADIIPPIYEPSYFEEAVTYVAPRSDWNPEKFAPPIISEPEAHNLPQMSYDNVWDHHEEPQEHTQPDNHGGYQEQHIQPQYEEHHEHTEWQGGSGEAETEASTEQQTGQMQSAQPEEEKTDSGGPERDSNEPTAQHTEEPTELPVEEPELAPIFPWEHRKREVTRVFDYNYSSPGFGGGVPKTSELAFLQKISQRKLKDAGNS